MPPRNPGGRGGNINRGRSAAEKLPGIQIEQGTTVNLLKRVAFIFGPEARGEELVNVLPAVLFIDDNNRYQCYFDQNIWLVHKGAHERLAEGAGKPKTALTRAYVATWAFRRATVFPHMDDIVEGGLSREAAWEKMRGDLGDRADVLLGGVTGKDTQVCAAGILLQMPDFMETAYQANLIFPIAEHRLKEFIERL